MTTLIGDDCSEDTILKKLQEKYVNVTLYMSEEIEKVRNNIALNNNAYETSKLPNYSVKRVNLNVGGKLFSINNNRLIKSKLFNIVLREQEKDKIVTIFVDRDPLHFGMICDYLRGDIVDTTDVLHKDKKYLLEEAEFYEIDGLVKLLKGPPKKKKPKKSNIGYNPDSHGCKLMASFEDYIKQTKQVLKQPEQTISYKIERYFKKPFIKINVGGTVFTTSKTTLNQLPDNLWCIELDDGDSDEKCFIDRSPDVFHLVLRILRKQTLPTISRKVRKNLKKELKKYEIEYGPSASSLISIEEHHNVSVVDNSYTANSNNVDGFIKNIKSNPVNSGVQYMSVRLDNINNNNKNIMIGCVASDNASVNTPNLYSTTGKWFYCAGGMQYGGWDDTANGTHLARVTPETNDIITLKLNVDNKTLDVYHTTSNYQKTTKWRLCGKVPQHDSYSFMVSMYTSNSQVTIVEVPQEVVIYE